MGYVDDVEFYFRPDASTVEYRSASRLGEGDFDVNRTRIRDIRKALQEAVRYIMTAVYQLWEPQSPVSRLLQSTPTNNLTNLT